MTIEQKTAETILQKPFEITVGAQTYAVSPPTIATLIMVSEAISQMPRTMPKKKNIVGESLAIATECGVLGDILAILILGAKYIKEEEWGGKNGGKPSLFSFKRKRKESTRERLARTLMEELSPSTCNKLAVTLLQRMEIGDFFGLTTFLIETNLLKPTKVVTEATASGQ